MPLLSFLPLFAPFLPFITICYPVFNLSYHPIDDFVVYNLLSLSRPASTLLISSELLVNAFIELTIPAASEVKYLQIDV